MKKASLQFTLACITEDSQIKASYCLRLSIYAPDFAEGANEAEDMSYGVK